MNLQPLSSLRYLDAATLAAVLPVAAAVDVLERALLERLDPTADPPRTSVHNAAGQLLLMPSAATGDLVVKLVSIAPRNAALGLPRIQGVVVLFDAVTLTPVALIDGIALTSLRTPAVSALAVRHLARADAHRLVVFGTGAQAEGHIAALRAVRPIDDVVLIGRDPGRAAALAARCISQGGQGFAVRIGSADDVAGADLVVCATTAREPLFDGTLIPDGCCVIAVGSHEPTAREVDADLVRRSRIVVEEVSTALREAGDLVLANVTPAQVESLGDVVRSRSPMPPMPPVPADRRPILIKTVGMAWEDAVVATAAVRRAGGNPG
jgi:ornithine cyclodeaminase